ncbi:MAG TPA: hypothetical protein VL475_15655 [Planctomycetaceae bacterium]|jgi:hypothetical protein|nr:hypothetical protein [Planctomycetaceae bacterium]
MSDELRELRDRLEALEGEVADLRAAAEHPLKSQKGVRKRSETELFGLPLWEIATGPDAERGERRGHARAVFAIGDVATGVFALGGIARGIFCVGGVTVGFVALGGLSISLVFAMAGLAIAPLAFGGATIGGLAVGGAAIGYVVVAGAGIGYYAKGAACIGAHAINEFGQDPQAVKFFADWLPWL